MFSTTPATVWPGLGGDRPGPLGDVRGGRLGSGHHQDLGLGQQLGHGDGDVAGARRQVQEEGVEVAEVDVGEELLQRPVQHRARARPPAGCR